MRKDNHLENDMKKELVHPELGKEVQAPAGYYIPLEESVINYQGRKVISILGSICIDSACCGSGNWNYVQVAGFLLLERFRQDASGLAVSEIESITDENDRQAIRKLLSEKYPSARIEIWD
jgi:hypothetical protein